MTVVKRFLWVQWLAVVLFSNAVFAQDTAVIQGGLVNFGQESSSEEVRQLATWIVRSRDNQTLPFLIVDKKNAKVFVFNPLGNLKAATAALLGSAIGDDSAQGIGQLKLSSIPAAQRTTPAGRFVASLSKNLQGKSVLWIDYDAAISLHRVVTSDPKQQRARRLASSTTTDNRISFGCINVSAEFYDRQIEETFKHTSGIVYVLPEIGSIQATFNAYQVGERKPPSNAIIKLR